LVALALLSLVGGWVGVPAALGGSNHFEHFLDPVFTSGAVAETAAAGSHGTEIGLAVVSVLTALIGLAIAWFFYVKKPGTAAALATQARPVYALVANKFYVDEIYNAVFVTGLLGFTRFFLKGFDWVVVDGSGWLAGVMAVDLGEFARRVQSGNIRSYAGWLALGAAVVMAAMIFGRGVWVH